MLQNVLRPTNRRARLFVGALIAGLFCIQCTHTTDASKDNKFIVPMAGADVGHNATAIQQKVIELARTNHSALLQYCLDNYPGRYRDYTCTFLKQERINGVLGKQQEIHVKFLESPYSVAMAWTPQTAPIGDRALYIKGKYDDQMLVRPKMFNNLIGTQLRKPDSADAMKNTLRPINMFGFGKSLQMLLEVYDKARVAGDLKESYEGLVEIDGRTAMKLVRELPPKNGYPACKTVTYIDLDWLVPVGVEGYDWDNQLYCLYIFKDLKFNVGLTAQDFTPEANEMKPVK